MYKMKHDRHTTPARRATMVASVAAILLGGAVAARQQQPSFRATVDVIEFDVRVVNDKGAPIVGLGADQFEVSLNGARRRVVSAALVQYGPSTAPTAPAARGNSPSSIWSAPKPLSLTDSSGRIFVLVVDAASFDAGSAGAVAQAARTFVSHLRPDDMVGLFVFPTGSQINPSTDRGRVMNALERISAQPAAVPGAAFNLRPSEVVLLGPIWQADVAGDLPRDAQVLVQLLCGDDQECFLRLRFEAQSLLQDYERHNVQGLGLLRTLIQNLATIQGRKTLVMISGGMATSNKPGGRPDLGGLDLAIGHEAVKTNTSIYTLFVNWQYAQQTSAERRQPARTTTTRIEDEVVLSRALDQFTGASGGALFKAVSGAGEVAFDRILNETSAYYVLGVEPAETDRDGEPRQLSVKVKQSGATVRGSRWVTVPRR